MRRLRNQRWLALWPIAGLLLLSVLVTALLPGSVVPSSAHNLFQSGVDSPLPTPTTAPPTATPLPPTSTPVPPTDTPVPPTPIPPTPVPPTPVPPTPEPPTPAVTPEQPTPVPEALEPTATPEPTPPPMKPTDEPTDDPAAAEQPTAESVHLPSVSTGDTNEQPELAPVEASSGEDAAVEQPPAPEIPSESPSGEVDSASQLADFIDGVVVIASYGWLACGVLLLLLVPVAILLFNRWGRRRNR